MSELTLISNLRQHLETNPEKNLYHAITGQSLIALTYAELDASANKVAYALQQLGAKTGDRVIIILSQPLDYLATFFGCLYASAIAVPVSLPARPEHFQKIITILQDCAAKFIITEEKILQ